MHSPGPHFQQKPASEPPAMVRSATREDVQWNRPIFKAPPLELFLKQFDATIFAEDLRRIGLGQR
jgi:hypothetical protein